MDPSADPNLERPIDRIIREGVRVGEIVPADPELQAWFDPQEAEADREIAASTLTVRWDEAHVALIKRAAAVLGVPLSSYVKQVLVRQALADIAQDAALR